MVGRCTHSSGSMRSTTPSSACGAISASCRSFSTSRFRTSTSITPGWARTSWRMPSPWTRAACEATKKAFFAAVDRGLYNAADHHFLWLWGNIPHAEALDLLLTVATPKNTLDEHYFIFPMFTWRSLDWLGRDHTSFLVRPADPYVTRFPTPPVLKDIEPLLEEYELLKRPLGFHTSRDEAPAIGLLGEAVTRCDTYAEIPRMLARPSRTGRRPRAAVEPRPSGPAARSSRRLPGIRLPFPLI